ncbi:MAG: hypothetical protein ACK5Z2_05285 [Bacteroidota bacterium]|jgi:hypothetical protein
MNYNFAFAFMFLLLLIKPSATTTPLYKAAIQNAGANEKSLVNPRIVPFLHDDYEGDSLLIDGLKNEKYLSAEDITYMHMQLKNNRAGIWTEDSLGDLKLLPAGEAPAVGLSPKKSTKAWTNYFKKHDVGFYEISRPVLSKDGMTAVLCVNFQCGVYCGNGGAYVFRLQDGVWKAVKNLYSWKK